MRFGVSPSEDQSPPINFNDPHFTPISTQRLGRFEKKSPFFFSYLVLWLSFPGPNRSFAACFFYYIVHVAFCRIIVEVHFIAIEYIYWGLKLVLVKVFAL